MGASREVLAELVRDTIEEVVDVVVEMGTDIIGSLGTNLAVALDRDDESDDSFWNEPDDAIDITTAGTQLATAITEMEEQVINNKKLSRTDAIKAAVDGTVRIITVGTPETPPMDIKPNQTFGERLVIRTQKEAPELLKELQMTELPRRDIWPTEFNIGDQLGERIKLARVELGKLAEEMIQD